MALRRIPVFDDVLRKLFGMFGEKPVRLAFQANAVRVSASQFGRVHRLYEDVARTMDAPMKYDVFVSQTPMVNAGAYGMDRPFIILNSGTVALLDDDELSFVHGALVTLRRRCGKTCCHCRKGRPHETRVFLERRGGHRKVHPLEGPRARHLRKAAELHRRLSRLRGRLPALLAEVLGAWDRLHALRQREGSRLYLQDRRKP